MTDVVVGKVLDRLAKKTKCREPTKTGSREFYCKTWKEYISWASYAGITPMYKRDVVEAAKDGVVAGRQAEQEDLLKSIEEEINMWNKTELHKGDAKIIIWALKRVKKRFKVKKK